MAWGRGTQEVSSTMTLTSGTVTEDGSAWTAVPANDTFSWIGAIAIVWLSGSIVSGFRSDQRAKLV
jgi:hypothetical protein